MGTGHTTILHALGTAPPPHAGSPPSDDTSSLRFQLLGPLEVVAGGRPVPLRGVQQRAVLSFLLLHANSVVATSDLIKALWRDDLPATSRKMLQNAVAGVRGVLAADPAARPVALLTHAPGYLLRVPPERIDLWRFQHLAEAGRARLVEGEWGRAAATLREALELWRGPMLADLTETGIAWPELAAAQNARLAALEDYAEAQLTLHQHQDVIGLLEAVLAGSSQPPRERLSGQLMIALYRSGRQADALSVYRRTRTALIEQLGLDPSRELQELERAILAHDPMLAVPSRGHDGSAALPPSGSFTPSGSRDLPAVAVPEQRRVARPAPAKVSPLRLAPAMQGPDGSDPATTERKPVTMLLLRAGIGEPGGDWDPEDLREAWQALAATVEQVVGLYGGTVRREAVGSLWTAWFGVPRTSDDDAERAVRAALELRRRLKADSRNEAAAPGGPLVVQLAVVSGEALVTCHSGDDAAQAEVTGGVLDTSLRLLTEVPAGQLRVCDVTRAVSGDTFGFIQPDGPLGGWAVTGPAQPDLARQTPPLVERTREQQLLRCMLGDVRRQSRAHLATVLGEPGIGRSRLIEEFRRLITEPDPAMPDVAPVQCVVVWARPFGGETVQAVLGELVHELTGEPARPTARRSGGRANSGLAGAAEIGSLCASSRQLIERLAEQAPLVLVFEDLHWADKRLLDYVEDLIHHAASLPLFVIATARPELLERRPYWGGGTGSATSVTLDPLSEDGVRDLLSALWRGHLQPAGQPLEGRASGEDPAGFSVDLVSRIGGNPRFAVEYVRHLHASGLTRPSPAQPDADPDELALPPAVHRVIAARLDALPTLEKAVLQDAAVLGNVVCAAGVAAISGRDPDEVARWLRLLESREFLRRVPGRPVSDAFGQIYVFRHSSVRQVAYTQLPRRMRADKHYRAATWLEKRTSGADDQFTHHYQHAVTLARVAARPLGSSTEPAGHTPGEAGRDGADGYQAA